MSKQDFLIEHAGFIDSEIYGAQQSEDTFTENEWREWIKKENADFVRQDERNKLFTDEEIDWIIEALDAAGVVAE